MIGKIGRIAGKSFISGFKNSGGPSFAAKLGKRKGIGKGAKLIAGTTGYAGQMAKSLTDPMMMGSMAMSYAPMMLMNQGGDMNYETQEALAPNAPPQQSYSASNILQPGPDDLARMQIQDQNGYYGG